MEKSASEKIAQVHEDRKFLRKLILEEAEKHGNEVKANVLFELDSENFGLENEGEMLLRRFEAEIENLIQNFYKKNVCESGHAVHRSFLAIGEESRRQIEARLITERKDSLREALKNELWTFSELLLLGDRDIQKVLRETDNGTLAKALKISDFNIQDKIYRNMSKKAAANLREEIEYMEPIRLIDARAAQDEIIRIMARLEEQGEIVLVRNRDERMLE
ncbi:FliG C-terminal domain-containing protein [Treponema sp. UBA3813]|uniref:FliG C-terminal domain-containing protein n=1 Tax=Treponema sp. UBA3813 TaxID=1947715 RepID=UPI0025F594C3|nr:FliG C-terminal domain-containing protein [Treponema sp. UBA3813]